VISAHLRGLFTAIGVSNNFQSNIASVTVTGGGAKIYRRYSKFFNFYLERI